MNYKQALVASSLGMRLTRPSWNGEWIKDIRTLDNGIVNCIDDKGNTVNLIGEAFTCEDWEIFNDIQPSNTSQ